MFCSGAGCVKLKSLLSGMYEVHEVISFMQMSQATFCRPLRTSSEHALVVDAEGSERANVHVGHIRRTESPSPL